jgi:DNA-binding IclR family transcriptional regulator
MSVRDGPSPASRPNRTAPEVWGAQSIHRATVLLRAIASRGRAGSRLVDLARHARLTRPTAHRILKCLMSDNVVMQDPQSRRYFLGSLIFELGLAAAPQFNLRQICEPTLRRIADKTGDTVFLIARSGFDAVCIDRVEGNFPIKALTLDVGTRRPLGVGAGGMALLLPLPQSQIEEIVAGNATRLKEHGNLNVPAVMSRIRRSKELGYALNDRQETPGAVSMGLAIPNPHGPPYAAISIGAIASRMSVERQKEIAAALRTEARLLERQLGEAARQ